MLKSHQVKTRSCLTRGREAIAARMTRRNTEAKRKTQKQQEDPTDQNKAEKKPKADRTGGPTRPRNKHGGKRKGKQKNKEQGKEPNQSSALCSAREDKTIQVLTTAATSDRGTQQVEHKYRLVCTELIKDHSCNGRRRPHRIGGRRLSNASVGHHATNSRKIQS